jgi:universal stress protein E
MTKPPSLLVVVDPTAAEQPAVARAAWLARGLEARLELFICDYDTHHSRSRLLDRSALAPARANALDSHLRRLEELAKPLRAAGLNVRIDARWDNPLHDGITRKAIDAGAALVIKDTHFHPLLKRSLFSNTDWNLIRGCPADLWLVKPRAIGTPARFVAAVDPLHTHDAPADFDRSIMTTAQRLAASVGGELHAFHAFDLAPLVALSSDSMTMPVALPLPEVTAALLEQHAAAVHKLTDTYALPRERVHVREGGTRALLIGLTEELAADVVVLGAVSRSGLKRLFLGSTAEQILDALGCDVVVVKPAGFEAALRG